MKYDLIISGRSSGGTNLIGRCLKAIRSKHKAGIHVLIETGDKQEIMAAKLRKEYRLVYQITGYDMPVTLYLEDATGAHSSPIAIADYRPNH